MSAHPRMTQAERLLMGWRPRKKSPTKIERLERLATEMRKREGHKRGGNSAKRAAAMRKAWRAAEKRAAHAARMRSVWAQRKGTATV